MEKISVRGLLMQAFLTGWEKSNKSMEQDAYLESSIHVIEVLQVEPEFIYAEEGMGLNDGEEVDHLNDLVRADGVWLYYGVEEENFFLLQWFANEAAVDKRLAQLAEIGEGENAYPVNMSLKRENPTAAENFGSSSPNMLRS